MRNSVKHLSLLSLFVPGKDLSAASAHSPPCCPIPITLLTSLHSGFILHRYRGELLFFFLHIRFTNLQGPCGVQHCSLRFKGFAGTWIIDMWLQLSPFQFTRWQPYHDHRWRNVSLVENWKAINTSNIHSQQWLLQIFLPRLHCYCPGLGKPFLRVKWLWGFALSATRALVNLGLLMLSDKSQLTVSIPVHSKDDGWGWGHTLCRPVKLHHIKLWNVSPDICIHRMWNIDTTLHDRFVPNFHKCYNLFLERSKSNSSTTVFYFNW